MVLSRSRALPFSLGIDDNAQHPPFFNALWAIAPYNITLSHIERAAQRASRSIYCEQNGLQLITPRALKICTTTRLSMQDDRRALLSTFQTHDAILLPMI
jgi:hypothetical protein